MKRPPCEWRVKELIPMLRASLAIILIKEYGYSIYQTSKVLGVTPAAISNYLTAKRSKETLVEKILSDEKMAEVLRKYAKKLIESELEAGDVLCILCRKLADYNYLHAFIEEK